MESIANRKGFNVSFENISDDYAVLSIAGPRARDVMSKLTDVDVSAAAWPFMHQKHVVLAGVPTQAFRLSYTGGYTYVCSSSVDKKINFCAVVFSLLNIWIFVRCVKGLIVQKQPRIN